MTRALFIVALTLLLGAIVVDHREWFRDEPPEPRCGTLAEFVEQMAAQQREFIKSGREFAFVAHWEDECVPDLRVIIDRGHLEIWAPDAGRGVEPPVGFEPTPERRIINVEPFYWSRETNNATQPPREIVRSAPIPERYRWRRGDDSVWASRLLGLDEILRAGDLEIIESDGIVHELSGTMGPAGYTVRDVGSGRSTFRRPYQVGQH